MYRQETAGTYVTIRQGATRREAMGEGGQVRRYGPDGREGDPLPLFAVGEHGGEFDSAADLEEQLAADLAELQGGGVCYLEAFQAGQRRPFCSRVIDRWPEPAALSLAEVARMREAGRSTAEAALVTLAVEAMRQKVHADRTIAQLARETREASIREVEALLGQARAEMDARAAAMVAAAPDRTAELLALLERSGLLSALGGALASGDLARLFGMRAAAAAAAPADPAALPPVHPGEPPPLEVVLAALDAHAARADDASAGALLDGVILAVRRYAATEAGAAALRARSAELIGLFGGLL